MSLLPENVHILMPAYKASKELGYSLPLLLKKVSTSDITIVIDGADRATERVCEDFGVKYILHPNNQGKGQALQTGFKALADKYEWVITVDSDGQHSPNDLEKFVDAIIQDRADIILGKRDMRLGKMPPARIFSNRSTSLALSLLAKKRISDVQCGYRAYRLSKVNSITYKYKRFEFESEVVLKLAKAGSKVINVPIETIYIEGGVSHISHIADTLRWIKAVIITMFTMRKK